MALIRTLLTHTNYLFPKLMVEVCLVLAPVVNFFLNSRKQGLPCWHSLSFFLSEIGYFRAYECFLHGWCSPTTWTVKLPG